MYTIILFTLLTSCAPPAEQRDLSYINAAQASEPISAAQVGHISTEEVSAIRVKVQRMREDTDEMRRDLDSLSIKLSSER